MITIPAKRVAAFLYVLAKRPNVIVSIENSPFSEQDSLKWCAQNDVPKLDQ